MGGHNRDSTRSVRLHLWAFYTSMRRMNETTNETTQPCKPRPNACPGLVFSLVRGGGGYEIRTPEGLPPTRFPSVRPGVHASPGQSVTWDDRNRRVTADAREHRRMRLRMRLQPKRTTDSGELAAGILLGLTPGEVARKYDVLAPARCRPSGRRPTPRPDARTGTTRSSATGRGAPAANKQRPAHRAH